MGTRFGVVLYAPDAARAEAAAAAAFERIAEIDARLSDYDPDSELSRLSAQSHHEGGDAPVPASQDLLAVLEAAGEISAASDGAFDVTVGPLVRLWREARRMGRLPDPVRLARARRAVDWRRVLVDRAAGTVRVTGREMSLDLGGIAKGYALDEALQALASQGVTRALVDGGGDVAVGEAPPGRAGWRVALVTTRAAGRAPADYVLLTNAACATSGDLYAQVEVDGVVYSHVVDPRTGLGVTARRAATVIAPSGMEADALASALCVLDPEQGVALLEERPGVEGRVWPPPEAAGQGPWDSSGFRLGAGDR